jgi:hypothetical protein
MIEHGKWHYVIYTIINWFCNSVLLIIEVDHTTVFTTETDQEGPTLPKGVWLGVRHCQIKFNEENVNLIIKSLL